MIKTIKLFLLSMVLGVAAFGQNIEVTSINYGSGNIVQETSGFGAPSGTCKSLERYVQFNGTPGANIWQCVNEVWILQGNAGGGGGGSTVLETNSVPNALQTILNLVNGTNTNVVYNGGGAVQVNVPGTAFDAYGAANTVQTHLNTLTSSLATVATSGSYNDLSNKPTIPPSQVNSDWNAVTGIAAILNKPTIPAAQVNSDWNAISGLAVILNKPTIPTSSNWPNAGSCPNGQFVNSLINGTFNATSSCGTPSGGGNVTGSGTSAINNLVMFNNTSASGIQDSNIAISTVTTQGNVFNGNSQLVQLTASGKLPVLDGSNLTDLPSAQVNSNWNAVTGVAVILNKPTIPAAQVAANLASAGSTGVTGTLPAAQVGTGYSYLNLSNLPTIPSVTGNFVGAGQANTYTTGLQDFSAATLKQPLTYAVGTNTITNPTSTGTLALTSQIPAAQVNSDWNAVTGIAVILNKPTIPTSANWPAQGTCSGQFISAITNGSAPTCTTITPTLAGLSNVTNNAQTLASIVPNTLPSAGQILIGNAGGTAYAPQTLSSDCTLTATGAITCSKSGGVAFGSGAFATAYTLPTATSSSLGGVKPDGTTLNNSSGAISVAYGSAVNTAAQGNDTRFPAAVTGLRKGAGVGSADTTATPGTDYLTPGALPNGTTATTQTAGDNSAKIATTAYVAAAVVAAGGGNVTGPGSAYLETSLRLILQVRYSVIAVRMQAVSMPQEQQLPSRTHRFKKAPTCRMLPMRLRRGEI